MLNWPFRAEASMGIVSSVHFFAEARAEKRVAATVYFIFAIASQPNVEIEIASNTRNTAIILNLLPLLRSDGNLEL